MFILATVVRFEIGNPVTSDTVIKLRKALEAKRVKIIDSGPLAGAVMGGLRKAR